MRVFFLLVAFGFLSDVIIAQNCNYTISDTTTSVSCNNFCDGYAGITVSGGGSPYIYSWSNGSNTNESFSLCAGTYTVLITDTSGCDSLYTVSEITNPNPLQTNITAINVICDIDGSIDVNSNGGYKPYKYLFTGYEDTLNSPFFDDLGTGTYTLTVVDRKGCVTDTTFDIIEQQCDEPLPIEAFSPNGDGINDLWSIANMNLFPNSRLTVYDRWGQKVYWSNGYDTAWDGHGIAGFLPASTYYYIIELDKDNKDTKIVKGSVSIVR